MDLGYAWRVFPDFLPWDASTDVDAAILDIVYELDEICAEVTRVRRNVTDFWDLDLEDSLALCATKLKRDLAGLKAWSDIKSSGRAQLCSWAGLLRDCKIVPVTESDDGTNRLTPIQLSHPLIRAAYMASTAYLEITSIDIVSDLIINAMEVYGADGSALVEDLAMQLLDECRHAELLAAHVEKMGYPVYLMPIELESWELYRKCISISEKLAAQQVLQESLGLEASASNIVVMEQVGDFEAAEIYAQLAADECNHVRLGIKWIQAYETDLDAFVEGVRTKIGQAGIELSIPLVKELRRICGWPEAAIARQASKRAELALSTIHEAIRRERL